MSVFRAFFGLGKLPKVVKFFEFESFDEVNKTAGAIAAIKDQVREGGLQLTKSQKKFLDDQQKQIEMVFEKISKPSDTGIKSTESAKIFNLQGEKLDPNLPITGGTQQGKKINPETFRRLAERGPQLIKQRIADKKINEIDEVGKRIDSGVAATVEKMLNMTPMDAMKEANSVIGRKGIYKNLSPEDAKKILQDTEDHIFERNYVPGEFDPDIEDFAGGGVAGMLGERQNFKMGRRAFLKMLAGIPAGIAALKTGFTGLGGKKVATEVAKDVATTSGGTPPPYFFNLVKKIKNLGDDVTPNYAVKERDKVTRYKDYELTEDLTTGEQTIQRYKIDDGNPTYYDEVLAEETYMNYKPGKGQADEATGKVADEYTEDTSYIRTSGPQKGDVYDTVEGVQDEVIQEGTVFEDNVADFITKEAQSIKKVRTKKAGGGVAYMLGQ
jgi:hypothetical protein